MRKTANGKCDVIFTPTSSGVNILQRAESNCRYYHDDLGSVLKTTLLDLYFLLVLFSGLMGTFALVDGFSPILHDK